MKHRKRDPGSGISSSKSNISRAMRGRIPKVPNFLAMRNEQPEASTVSHSEQPTTSSTNTTATTQPSRSSDRTRRSPSYYGFKTPPTDFTIAAPPKRSRRAGDIENFQPPSSSVVETEQNIAEQQPTEFNVSPRIGEVSLPTSRNLSLLEIDTPTLVRSMIVYEAENPDANE